LVAAKPTLSREQAAPHNAYPVGATDPHDLLITEARGSLEILIRTLTTTTITTMIKTMSCGLTTLKRTTWLIAMMVTVMTLTNPSQGVAHSKRGERGRR